MQTINLDEIEQVFKLIIKKLKKENLDNVQFDFDEYWEVLSKERFDFANTPKPSVGSLNDDVSYLKKTIEEGVIYSYNELDRIASVLRYISEKEAPSISNIID